MAVWVWVLDVCGDAEAIDAIDESCGTHRAAAGEGED
jgi:hypothetical protein